jgi:cyclophilin family peptidyl-prolyl cis-trans isomerase
VASEKRARQRAARQAKLQREAAQRRKKKFMTQGIILAVLVVVVVGLIYLLSSSSPSKKASNNVSKKVTTTVKSGTTTTTVGATTATTLSDTAMPIPASNACPSSIQNVPRKTSFSSAPPMLINTSGTYYANLQTNLGNIKIKLDPTQAPKTVNNFVFLACYHFYDGTIFHRVIPNFMDQGGSPNGLGTGNPGYTIPDEYPTGSSNKSPYAPGQIAMANSGTGNSGGSQFFIVDSQSGAQTLDNDIASPGAEDYTIFGNVVPGTGPDQGMSVVQAINALGTNGGTPTQKIDLYKVTITSS